MPMIRNMVKEISGKEPSTPENPDQCVAIGAAYSGQHYILGQERWEVRKFKSSMVPCGTYFEKALEDFKRIDSFLALA